MTTERYQALTEAIRAIEARLETMRKHGFQSYCSGLEDALEIVEQLRDGEKAKRND